MNSNSHRQLTRAAGVLAVTAIFGLSIGRVTAQQPANPLPQAPAPVSMQAPAPAPAAAAPAIETGTAAPSGQAAAVRPQDAQTPVAYPRVPLTAGKSTVLATEFDVTRIAVTNPAVADATVVQPREVLVDGKAAGTISLIVWGAGGRRDQYDIVVQPAITNLQTELQTLFPGEDIHVHATDDAVVISGHASSNPVSLRAAEIAQASAPKVKVINMLQLPGGGGSQQVLLQVRFAEVNRQALMQLGVSLFTGATGANNWLGRTTTQQFAAPGFDQLNSTYVNGQLTNTSGQITFSDFLNVFLFNFKANVGALVQALQTTGNLQSLAEPNLIAYNGQTASFLAGGEIPVPVVQGVSNAVTIVYKEFGIRLNFTPTIAGDVIRLHLRPEVSSLDFPDGITLSGFRIPALTTRYAETEVELRDGQSFAIAGLMNNTSQLTKSMIPGLGNLPIIGYLFKSKADSRTQTELMVLVTPRLIRPLNPDEVPSLPTSPKGFLPPAGTPGKGDSPVADAPPVTPPPAPAKKRGGRQ
jgi:pilus assembly protein CpaC